MGILMVYPYDTAPVIELRDGTGHHYSVTGRKRPRFYNARVVEVQTDREADSLRHYFWEFYDGPVNESIPYNLVEGDEVDYEDALKRIEPFLSEDALREALSRKGIVFEEPTVEVGSLDIPDEIDIDNYTRKQLVYALGKAVPGNIGAGLTKAKIVERIEDAFHDNGEVLTASWLDKTLDGADA